MKRARLLVVLLLVSRAIYADSWDSTAKEAAKDSQIRAYRMVKISRACGQGFARVGRFSVSWRGMALWATGGLTYWYFRPWWIASAAQAAMDDLLSKPAVEFDTDEEKEELARELARLEMDLMKHDLASRREVARRLFYLPLGYWDQPFAKHPYGNHYNDNDYDTVIEVAKVKGSGFFNDWEKTPDGQRYAKYFDPVLYPRNLPYLAGVRAKVFRERMGVLENGMTVEDWIGPDLYTSVGATPTEKKVWRRHLALQRLLQQPFSKYEGMNSYDLASKIADTEQAILNSVDEDSPVYSTTKRVAEDKVERMGGSTYYYSPRVMRDTRERQLQSSIDSARGNPEHKEWKLETLGKEVPFVTAKDLGVD